MDIGFVVLCPDRNVAGLKNTMCSINHNTYNREAVAVVGDDATPADIKQMKEFCPTYKGKETITSLVNLGIKKLKHEWAFLVFGGSRLQPYLERKIEPFIKTEKDVLFPVVERRCDFVSSSFNGVVINTKFFQEVGGFTEAVMMKEGMNDFELAKLFWCIDALEKQAIFKGIVGLKIT